MYSNYQLPYNYSMRPSSSSSINRPYSQSYNNSDRIIGGGFLAPFLLGGIAGAAVAPAFYGGYNRPYYYNNYYYPYPVYYYRPY